MYLVELGKDLFSIGLGKNTPTEAPDPAKLEASQIDNTFLYVALAVGVLMMAGGFYLVFKK